MILVIEINTIYNIEFAIETKSYVFILTTYWYNFDIKYFSSDIIYGKILL